MKNEPTRPVAHWVKRNKLVIAPGLLTGTPAPYSARLSIGAKSPLTGGIKESNGGGTVARKLANLGIKAIILEGQPEDSSVSILIITSSHVMILSAEHMAGMGNYETVDRIASGLRREGRHHVDRTGRRKKNGCSNRCHHRSGG